MSMSLDGFIADASDGVEHIFGWYGNGPVAVTMPGPPPMTVHLSEASAVHFRQVLDSAGAIVCGRRLFDHTQGWGGSHPVGVPVFVVTHTVPEGWPRPDAPFTFVTEGVESAVEQAKAVAGDGKIVSVAGANIAQQCLNAGLLDEVRVNLVPVLMGAGRTVRERVVGSRRVLRRATTTPFTSTSQTAVSADRQVYEVQFRGGEQSASSPRPRTENRYSLHDDIAERGTLFRSAGGRGSVSGGCGASSGQRCRPPPGAARRTADRR